MLYVLVFVLGVGTGIGLMLWNKFSVEKVENKCEKDKDVLAEQVSSLCDQLQQHWRNDAYRKGYEEGRLNPYNEAERFAKQFSERQQNVKFQLRDKRLEGTKNVV